MQNHYIIIAGYAGTFNNLDSNNHILMPDSLSKQETIPLLYGHKIELGQIIFLQEDSYGLYMEAVIVLDQAWKKSLYRKIKKGHITGLSLGLLMEVGVKEEDHFLIEEALILEVSITSQPINRLCQIGFCELFT